MSAKKQPTENTTATVNVGCLGRSVRPAFWLIVCAAQRGPDYEPWGWERLIDVAIRFAISFGAACMTVNALRSNVKICSTRTRVEHNRLVCASTREREKAFPQTDNLSPKPAASFSFPPSNFPDRGGLTSPPLGAPVSSNSVEPPERSTAALS